MASREQIRHLRHNMTDAERLLWFHLRAHRLSGHKFRRQHPIGPYVVDFVHLPARLAIEADGGQHASSNSDTQRDAWLMAQGFRVMRFWNDQILTDTESVLRAIWNALDECSPPLPSPSPARGEGL